VGKDGEPIDYTNLMTPEQQQIMAGLGEYLGGQLGETATAYPGTLNAQYDPAQLAAMNVMMGLGGQGAYNAPNIPVGAQAQFSDLGGVAPSPGSAPLPDITVGPMFGPEASPSPDVEPSPIVSPNITARPSPDVEPSPIVSPNMTARPGDPPILTPNMTARQGDPSNIKGGRVDAGYGGGVDAGYTYGRVVPNYLPI